MMGYGCEWQENSPQGKMTDLDGIFNAPGFNVAKLLNTDNIVDLTRNHNDRITQKLVQNSEILRELFDICFKPALYRHEEIPQLDTQLTFRSLEILTNLTEEFAEFMLGTDNRKSEDDDVVTDLVMTAEPNPVWLHCVSVLREPKPVEQVPLSYLTKVLTSFSYQKPKQIIQFFSGQQQYAQALFQHFYSRSICQFFSRLMEAESSSFFEFQKLRLLHYCQQSLQTQNNQSLLQQKLENYKSLLEFLGEKTEDRFDHAKFCSLVRQMLASQQQLQFLLQAKQPFCNEVLILEKKFQILEKYLSFSTALKQAVSKLSANNLSNSVQQIRMSPDTLSSIQSFVSSHKSHFQEISNEKFYLINYLRLVKALITVDPFFVPKVIDPRFLRKLISLFRDCPQNNVIHNLVKEVIIYGLQESYEAVTSIILDEANCGFVELVRIMGHCISCVPYGNQIYHIFQAVVTKGELNQAAFVAFSEKIEGFSTLTDKLKETEKFYSQLIGGNPRKESSCWGDSATLIKFDQILPPEEQKAKLSTSLSNDKDPDIIQGKQQHWFDCMGLPLDSDQSEEEEVQTPELDKMGLEPNSFDSYELRMDSVNKSLNENQAESKGLIEAEGEEVQGSFNKHFNCYISYTIDEALQQLE